MFQDCECCGTGVAIGYRVEKVTLKLRADGTAVLPWELKAMSESEKALLRTETRHIKLPVAYMDQSCPPVRGREKKSHSAYLARWSGPGRRTSGTARKEAQGCVNPRTPGTKARWQRCLNGSRR